MSQDWKKKQHLTMKPEVSKIFDDLEAYHDWCRFELCDFNPAHLYDKGNPIYRAYLNSTRPQRPWQNKKKRNEQNFSS
jgi:hypothetical protein